MSMRATAEPQSSPAVVNIVAAAVLNDAEQPQDQDQHQDAAKTDIHDTLLCLVLLLKRWSRRRRSTRYVGGRIALRV